MTLGPQAQCAAEEKMYKHDVQRNLLAEQLGARVQLVGLFGGTRDEWMARDLDDWLGANRIYPGVADILKTLKDRSEVYIVTTKQVTRVWVPGWCTPESAHLWSHVILQTPNRGT
jgi:hypothetical protein